MGTARATAKDLLRDGFMLWRVMMVSAKNRDIVRDSPFPVLYSVFSIFFSCIGVRRHQRIRASSHGAPILHPTLSALGLAIIELFISRSSRSSPLQIYRRFSNPTIGATGY